MNDPRDLRQGSAERQGRRDLTAAGFGILVLGLVGAVGGFAVGGKSGDAGTAAVALVGGGGAVLIIFAGSMMAGSGLRARYGAVAGLTGGCLGGLLFLAALVFLCATCTTILTVVR